MSVKRHEDSIAAIYDDLKDFFCDNNDPSSREVTIRALMAWYDQLFGDETKTKATTIALLVEELASRDATYASLKKEFETRKQVKEERIAVLQKQLAESLKTIEELKEEGRILCEMDAP